MTHAFDERSHSRPDCIASAKIVAVAAAARAEALDEDGAFPIEDIAALREAALLLAPFPLPMGGSALGSDPSSPQRLMEVLVAIGGGSLSLGRLYEGHVNAVKLVLRYGDASNLDLLWREAVEGRPTGVWMAEAGPPLRLVPDRSTGSEPFVGRLEGRKVLASGAGYIRRPLIAARTEAGSVMVIPRIDDIARADSRGWTTLGMRATATGDVDFTGLRVDASEIVGCPDDYMRSPLFRGGAWRVIATQLGGVEAILAAHGNQLAGSRDPSDPVQLARYGEALIAAETARLWVESACRTAEREGADAASVDAYVDLARNAFEQSALRVIALAQKAVGLRAFLRPNSLERIIRDLSTYLRQPALDASLASAAAFHLAGRKT